MRIFTAGLLLWPLSLINLVSAFPGQMNGHNGHSGHQDIHKRCPYANAQDQAKPKTEHEKRFLLSLIKSPVDSMSKTSSHAVTICNKITLVTNEHAFQPPDFENGDQRGPCPGLNALANHGYIPRSGVVSVGCSLVTGVDS